MSTSRDTPFVRGAEKLGRRIATVRANLDLPELTESITNLLLVRNLQRFEREVDPSGKRWPELDKATLLKKKRKGAINKILQDSGDMKRAIKHIRGGAGTVFTNTGAGSRIGIEDEEIAEYARIHNQGLAGFKMRRFLGVGALDIKAADSLMRRKAKQLERL